jgi:hypothetical protein
MRSIIPQIATIPKLDVKQSNYAPLDFKKYDITAGNSLSGRSNTHSLVYILLFFISIAIR